jgi:hypothetical protein
VHGSHAGLVAAVGLVLLLGSRLPDLGLDAGVVGLEGVTHGRYRLELVLHLFLGSLAADGKGLEALQLLVHLSVDTGGCGELTDVGDVLRRQVSVGVLDFVAGAGQNADSFSSYLNLL